MELFLKRFPSKHEATLGEVFLDGIHLCYTLEDQVREVFGQPVEKWKQFGVTAIPVGRYEITLEKSSRFGDDTITLNNVRGYDSIRGHAGNYAGDTEGCLLIGLKIKPDAPDGLELLGSKDALAIVKMKIKSALLTGAQVWITILSDPADWKYLAQDFIS